MTRDDSPDRRRGVRVAVNREFQTIAEFIAEYASDISASGVFIRTDDPLPVGTTVDLRFTVIVEDFETVEGTGVVVRAVEPGGATPAGMGIAFQELTPASQEVLARLLRQRDEGDT